MLDALWQVIIGLVTNVLFAVLAKVYQRARRRRAERGGGVTDSSPPAVEYESSGRRLPTDVGNRAGDRDRHRLDVISFCCLVGLSLNLVVPALLGGLIFAAFETGSDGTSSFITDEMRRHGEYGYVQYWLGFSIFAAIEVAILLFRPWRGRVFGVSLGIALAVFLVFFAIPASRGTIAPG